MTVKMTAKITTSTKGAASAARVERPFQEFADATIRVRYAETDQMGVVYYGNYFTWFEIGRVELCRQLGFEYKKMEIEDDSFLVVAESRCRYKRPARFDDLLTVRTRIAEAQRRMLRFSYEIIHQETAETIATGETTHVICNRAGQTKSLPEKYRAYLPVSTRPATADGRREPSAR